MNSADIDSLIADSESENLEFKEAKDNFDNAKLLRYCVALANEGGGSLVLGVTDRPPRTVVGTNAFSDRQKLISLIYDRLRIHAQVSVVNHTNGRVVHIGLPSRSVGTAYQLDGAY